MDKVLLPSADRVEVDAGLPRFGPGPWTVHRPYGRKMNLRRRFDADAQSYFNRMAAAGTQLAVEDRMQVSSFVRGLKTLGVWPALIEGWLFQSALNAGTGSVAYGLRGVSNGTLMNGVAWDPRGMVFTDHGQSIGLGNLPAFNNTVRSGLVVYMNVTVGSVGNCLFWICHGSPQQVHCVVYSVLGVGLVLVMTRSGWSGNVGARSAHLGEWSASAFSMDDTSDYVYRNRVLEDAGVRTGLTAINPTLAVDSAFFGCGFSGDPMRMQIAASVLFNVPLGGDVLGSLYDLIRGTVCGNVTLP